MSCIPLQSVGPFNDVMVATMASVPALALLLIMGVYLLDVPDGDEEALHRS